MAEHDTLELLRWKYLESLILVRDDGMRRRHIPFSGAKNFRDLGGYQAANERSVRWRMLYRSDDLHKLTNIDLQRLSVLYLNRVIDFRAVHETEREPDRLPAGVGIRQVEIPILDSSTRVWHDSREAMVKNLQSLDPAKYMVETNVELATRFMPEMRKFMGEVFSADGYPILFHCTAGKDRTGFAAAILLRMLGIPLETVMQDYLLTNEYFLTAYKWRLMLMQILRGKKFISGVKGFMSAHPQYLSAAFETIDREHGSFENYVRDGLRLTDKDVEHLRMLYLE